MAQDTRGLGISATDHPLSRALETRAVHWSRPRVELGTFDPGWATASALFGTPSVLDDFLAYQAACSEGLDLKGAAAYAVIEYSQMFALTTAPLLVGCGLVPDVSPDVYALRIDTQIVDIEGRPQRRRVAYVRYLSRRFWTADHGHADHEDAVVLDSRNDVRDVLRVGVEVHFAPLIEGLHRRSGLPRQALWRLVGDSLAGIFLDAGYRFDCKESAQADALAVLKQPGSPLNNRQLHYFDVAVRDEADPERILMSRSFRARGGCCRYYTVPGGKLCSTCVLKDPVDRDRDIEDRMRQRLGLPARENHAIRKAATDSGTVAKHSGGRG